MLHRRMLKPALPTRPTHPPPRARTPLCPASSDVCLPAISCSSGRRERRCGESACRSPPFVICAPHFVVVLLVAVRKECVRARTSHGLQLQSLRIVPTAAVS